MLFLLTAVVLATLRFMVLEVNWILMYAQIDGK